MSAKHALFASALAVLASACSHRDGNADFHLVGKDTADPADIRLAGQSGTATWSWGPKNYEQRVAIVEDRRGRAMGIEAGGVLKLKLDDGTPLTLTGDQNVWVCQGCDGVHMPIAWVTAPKE